LARCRWFICGFPSGTTGKVNTVECHSAAHLREISPAYATARSAACKNEAMASADMPRKSTGRPDAKAVRTDEAAVGETAERIKRSVPVRAVVALGLGVIAAIAFLEIADFVREGHSTVLDRAVSLRVHELDSDGMDRVMKAFTVAGEIRAIVILAATLAAVLVWQRARA